MKIKIFENDINENNLIEYYTNPKNFIFKEIDLDVDVTEIRNTIASFEFNKNENRKRPNRSKTDAIISPIIHKTFKDIPKNIMLDKKFLNYLSLVEFEDYVWGRWLDASADLPKNNNQKIDYIKNGKITKSRIIGNNLFKSNPSIHPISRLFWSAELLYDKDDYNLLRAAYSEQDFILQLFERQMNLNPELAKSFTRLLEKKSFHKINDKGKEVYDRNKFRNEQKKLNFYGSTMNLEHIDYDNLDELLSIN